MAAFTTQRGGRLLPFGGNKRGVAEGPNQNVNPLGASPDVVNDARAVYPCKIHHNGRSGGLSTLYVETAQARLEWKVKLEEAIGLRKVIQESNKVFEAGTLSTDTFFAPTLMANTGLSWNNDENFTGKVTCSATFGKRPSIPTRVSVLISWVTATPDGRGLVAIGCAEGVWVGSRHDSRCTYSPPPWSPFFLTPGVCLAMQRVLHLLKCDSVT